MPLINQVSARLLVAIVLTAIARSSGAAQIIRGTVVEAVTGIPLPGVIVTLVAADGRAAAEGLTTDSGNFALRAPAPGRYTVDVKRIGVKRTSSQAVLLQSGETTDMRLTLTPTAVSLPEVRVGTPSRCGMPATEGHSLAALWEDARAALTATRLTHEQHGFIATVVQYSRQLDPNTLRKRSEERRERSGLIAKPFSSVSADELTRYGYIRTERDGTTWYRAPDADVLLSDSFLAHHCFRVRKGEGIRSEFVGIAFEPTPERDVPDVTGTLWLDRVTHHLHSLDFHYTHLPDEARHDKVGGHIEFASLPSGAWIIRRWWLRMPLLRPAVEPGSGGLARGSPRRLFAIQETGGEVITRTADTAIMARTGVLMGIVLDSTTHLPLHEATVLVMETDVFGRSSADGRFRVANVPAGSHKVSFMHPRLDSLGIPPPTRPVTILAGGASRIVLAVPPLAVVVAALCHDNPSGTGVVRGVARDSTDSPLPGAKILITERAPRDSKGALRIKTITQEATADAWGRYLFCGVRPDYQLQLSLDIYPARHTLISIGPGDVLVRDLRP